MELLKLCLSLANISNVHLDNLDAMRRDMTEHEMMWNKRVTRERYKFHRMDIVAYHYNWCI